MDVKITQYADFYAKEWLRQDGELMEIDHMQCKQNCGSPFCSKRQDNSPTLTANNPTAEDLDTFTHDPRYKLNP